MEKLIDRIALPEGLRSLTREELQQVVEELREELISVISECGGHFASSLGVTEISVALHTLFSTPEDRIVWDVGHQAYIHKMLTGRRSGLSSIRKKGGISGFLRRDESPYDSFGAGHAGTSISAAVGMAVGLKRKGDTNRKVIAVIGDGSLTSGMAFEALNHAGELELDNLIVILNDNEMSIAPNVGALSRLFSFTVTGKAYTTARNSFKSLFKKGYVPELLYKAFDRAEEAAQGFFATPAMLFESFGFRYIGPVNGNDLDDVLRALENAKSQGVPVVVHARTLKGKGYSYAEEDPITWHGVNPFDPGNGKFIGTTVTPSSPPPAYTNVFADTLTRLASQNPKIIGITAAMPGGTGLDRFQKMHPDAFFDVGICEQHAVTYAAGLATEGFHPVCAIYSTFLQRAYDQVVHDVCIQKLPVTFAIDRGGVVGNDGETHQGVFDIAYLRTVPNIMIMSPKDENELQHMLATSVNFEGPTAIRYPRGAGVGIPLDEHFKDIPIGKGEVIQRGSDVLFIALGPMVQSAIRIAKQLVDDRGITSTIINARFVKPLDQELFSQEIPNYQFVCVLEDHALAGGFSSAVMECINDHDIVLQNSLLRFGVQDQFVSHASQLEQHQQNGYDVESIWEALTRKIDEFTTSRKWQSVVSNRVA